MSASYSVRGIAPIDDKFKTMKEIYDLCYKNDINIPLEVQKFFDYDKPRDEVIVNIEDAISYPETEYCHVIQVNLAELPKNVKVIEFEVSY